MPNWSAVGLFCDDIRSEASGVDSLIGVMSDNVAVPSVPAMLPKLGIYTRVNIRIDAEVETISVKADFFDGIHQQSLGTFDAETVAREKEGAARRGSPLIGFIFRTLLSPLPIQQYGRIRLWAKINDEEFICGSLNFEPPPGADSSALPPHS